MEKDDNDFYFKFLKKIFFLKLIKMNNNFNELVEIVVGSGVEILDFECKNKISPKIK